MKKKKLLYVINHMDWFWSHRIALAEGVQNEGWDVYVCAPGATADPRLGKQGFKPLDLPRSAGQTISHINRIIKEEEPDLLHAITLKHVFLSGIAVRLHKKTRAVFTLAGLGYLFSNEGLKPKLLRLVIGPVLKWVLKNPRAQIIFQNPDDQNLMTRKKFVNPDRCHLIPGSGVDTQEFPASPEPENEVPHILMPTRLVRDKGVEIFIEAAKILAARGINARFEIAGGLSPANPKAFTKEEMEKITARTPVKWLGKVDDMPGLLQKTDIVVYPSWYGEGIPKVLLEAASSARAIITTDHPGCREAVHHNKNGLLVPVKNPQATAEAIQSLMENPRERLRMGRYGRKRAEEEFDVRKIVSRTLLVYGQS